MSTKNENKQVAGHICIGLCCALMIIKTLTEKENLPFIFVLYAPIDIVLWFGSDFKIFHAFFSRNYDPRPLSAKCMRVFVTSCLTVLFCEV